MGFPPPRAPPSSLGSRKRFTQHSAGGYVSTTGTDSRTGTSTRVRGEWWALAIVLLAVVGFALSSPRFAAPDEEAHQATAWYVTTYGMPPKAETRAEVPTIFRDGACFATNGRQDASCHPAREGGYTELVRVMNYPPPYYWVVGIGQQASEAIASDAWMDLGGRAASFLLNVTGLVLLALLIRRHYRMWGTYLLLIVTPMAAFLWATVNPSGWEVTAGLLFAYLFARAWWHNDDDPSGTTRWPLLAAIAVTSVLFALARHSAMVWMAGLIVAIAATGLSRVPRAQQWKALLATAPGFLAGVLWQLTHPAVHVINNPNRIEDPQPLDFAHYFLQIEEVLPDRLRQMVGVLGWLDTPVPQWMFFLVLIGWAAFIGFLFARTRIPVLFLVVGFLGTFLVPTVLEMLRWNDWPYWYQGRITLPFALPFLLILLLRYAGRGQRAASALSLVTGFVLTFMVWQNLMRYSFGVWDYIPERWSDPAISDAAFWLTYLCIGLMLIGLIYRAVLLARDKRMITGDRSANL